MNKHVIAINVLKDELAVIAERVKYLQAVQAKMRFTEALFPNIPSTQVYQGLRYRRALKDQLKRGNSILESIKSLEKDI